MSTEALKLANVIVASIQRQVARADTATTYREPLVAFASASDERFLDLQRVIGPEHALPQDLLPGARAVVSFFLPFASWIVQSNAQHRERVSQEWGVAYIETNALIQRITERLVESLARRGVRAVAEPPTHNFDPVSLRSRWSHKSVAVIAGLGSFGLHHMVITDSGCAGRFGSLVVDAPLPRIPSSNRQRCRYFHDGSCMECVLRCPVNALDENAPLDKQRCYQRLLNVSQEYADLGLADVCGKCAVGPCALGPAV